MMLMLMSMKSLAVLAAVQQHDGLNNMTSSYSGARSGTSLHGNVNVLLSGAMLSGLILVVFLICYCCHRNMNKNASTRSPQYWQEDTDVPLEIFTVDGQCYEVSGVFLPTTPSCASFDHMSVPPRIPVPSPPPAYESLIVSTKKEEEVAVPIHQTPTHQEKSTPEEDDSGLPTYEAALRLEAQGYV